MRGVPFTRATYFGDGAWDLRASAELGYDFMAVGGAVPHPVAYDDLRDMNAILARLEDRVALARWLCEQCGVSSAGADQMVAYTREAMAVLGTLPTQDTLVAERFFDEAGGMQLVIHSPFGARLNRAFGLALRKRFCVSFDFELQAAATDDGIVLSLGEQHSFPVESIFAM